MSFCGVIFINLLPAILAPCSAVPTHISVAQTLVTECIFGNLDLKNLDDLYGKDIAFLLRLYNCFVERSRSNNLCVTYNCWQKLLVC